MSDATTSTFLRDVADMSGWEARDEVTRLRMAASETEAETSTLTAANELLAARLQKAHEAIYDATLEAISGGACYPGARELLQSCGVEVPMEEHTYRAEVSFTARCHVLVDVEVDALDAHDGEADPLSDVDRETLRQKVEDTLSGSIVAGSVDYYSAEVYDSERIT